MCMMMMMMMVALMMVMMMLYVDDYDGAVMFYDYDKMIMIVQHLFLYIPVDFEITFDPK
jgi:hypothetical protein